MADSQKRTIDEVEETLLTMEKTRDEENTLDDGQQQDQINALLQLKKEKSFFLLQKDLQGAFTASSASLEKLQEEVERVIIETEALHQKAKKLEEEEDFTNALQLYQRITEKVSDFPAIQTDISRVEQTLSFMEEIGLQQEDEQPLPQEEKHDNKRKKGKKKKATKEYLATRSFSRRMLSWKIFPFILILLLAGAAVSLFFLSQRNEKKANLLLQTCARSLEKKYYQTAQDQCGAAIQTAKKIIFFFETEKKQIISAAERVLHSDVIETGLSSTMIIDGKQYSLENANRLLEFRQKKMIADSLYIAGNFKKAAESYRTAAQLAEEGGLLLTNETKNSLALQINRSFLHYDLQVIEEYKSKNDPKALQKAVAEADEMLSTLPQFEQNHYKAILLLKKIEIRLSLATNKADEALLRERWKTAIVHYEEALKLIVKIPTATDADIRDLRKKKAKAVLYQALSAGNKAFAKGKWDDAIVAYTKANNILTDPTLPIVSQEEFNRQDKRLKKIILQAVMVREQESIQKMLDKAQIKSARNLYLKLLNLIKNSNVNKDQELILTEQKIQEKLKELNHQISMNEKKAYLQENYTKFFAEFYPNVKSDNLQNPKISVKSEDEDQIVFRLQCNDKSGSHTVTLLMTCRYDKKEHKWSNGSHTPEEDKQD